MLRALFALVLLAGIAGAPAPGAAQDFFRNWFSRWREPPAERQQEAGTLPARKALPGRLWRHEGGPAPYEAEFSRLAEILGALHYLRPLCGTADGDRWRTEMQELIDAEQPSPERRDRIVASFNNSYVAFGQTYRNCTPAAGLAIRRYLDEGARLSREIATKYGN